MFELPCRNPACHRRGGYRRGLCQGCYYTPGLRAEHAEPAKTPARGPGLEVRDPRVCVHCAGASGRPVNRPRGLCRTCYYTPGVRERYQPVSDRGRLGLGRGYGHSRPLPEPTEAMPGTPEKLAVLEDRALAEQQLWHPLDAGMTDGSPAALAGAFVKACEGGW